jgi:hypothetical protein
MRTLFFSPHNIAKAKTGAHTLMRSLLRESCESGETFFISSKITSDRKWSNAEICALAADFDLPVILLDHDVDWSSPGCSAVLESEAHTNFSEFYGFLSQRIDRVTETFCPDQIIVNYAYWHFLMKEKHSYINTVCVTLDLLDYNRVLRSQVASDLKAGVDCFTTSYLSSFEPFLTNREFDALARFDNVWTVVDCETRLLVENGFPAANIRQLNDAYTDIGRIREPKSLPYAEVGQPPPYFSMVSSDNLFNLHGILLFINKILPRIRALHPAVMIKVAGSIGQHFQRQRVPNVEFCGYIDDVRAFVKHSKALLVPQVLATGRQIKLVEFSELGLPIIMFDRLRDSNNVDLNSCFKVVETPDEFADEMLELSGKDGYCA